MIKRSKLCGLLGALAGRRSRPPDAVTVQLDWVVRGNHAPFFVARDKGYFAEQGIDAGTIRKGTGSTDALRLVANGNADFGSDLPTLMVGRSQASPTRRWWRSTRRRRWPSSR